jgi:putative membrane protein
MKQNKILKNILYIIQGAIVGIGAILPGVSGGVLCVAFGIYEPMMEL